MLPHHGPCPMSLYFLCPCLMPLTPCLCSQPTLASPCVHPPYVPCSHVILLLKFLTVRLFVLFYILCPLPSVSCLAISLPFPALYHQILYDFPLCFLPIYPHFHCFAIPCFPLSSFFLSFAPCLSPAIPYHPLLVIHPYHIPSCLALFLCSYPRFFPTTVQGIASPPFTSFDASSPSSFVLSFS